MGKFQLLPPLSQQDYDELKSDIAKRGVIVAVEYDEDGEIIDGFHRVRICKELRIKDWPRIVRTYPDDAARRTQARKLNLARRHLDSKTKRELIKAELSDNPDRSDRQVAAGLGVSHPTVAKVRRDGEATGKIYQLPKRKGVDGKSRKQPASKPKKSKKEKEPELQLAAEKPSLFDNPHLTQISECVDDLRTQLRRFVASFTADERAELFLRLSHLIKEWERIGNEHGASR